MIGRLAVRQSIAYGSIVSLYKIRQNKEPEELVAKLNSRNGRIKINNARLSLLQDGFVYRAATNWDNFPTDIKTATSLEIFTSRLKAWV